MKHLLFPKRIFPFLLLMLFLLPLASQAQRNQEDVVYLKNGGVLRGSLLPQDSVGIIRIEILGKNILAFPVSDVSSITREPVAKAGGQQISQPISYKKRGYYNLTQVGLAAGGTYYTWAYEEGTRRNLGFEFINGYQVHRLLSAGLGVGIDLYPQGPMLPVFLDLRGDVLQKPVTPHYYGHVGYNQPMYKLAEDNGWQTDSKVEGGLMYAAGAGVKFNTKGAISFIFTMGYRSQEVTESFAYLNGEKISQKVTYQRISLQAGVMF